MRNEESSQSVLRRPCLQARPSKVRAPRSVRDRVLCVCCSLSKISELYDRQQRTFSIGQSHSFRAFPGEGSKMEPRLALTSPLATPLALQSEVRYVATEEKVLLVVLTHIMNAMCSEAC